jgi:SEC-C motif-containing protein
MSETSPCPCNSGKPFADCCGPYITGKKRAPGPEELMRSRYTAYAMQNMPYLLETLHPGQRHDYDESGAKKWASESEWEGLEVVNVATGAADADSGKVEFRATYRRDGEHLVHHEIAEFRKSGDNWYFFDGKMVGPGQYKRDTPKTGRNDPCPCGSGKKFKKCCGR